MKEKTLKFLKSKFLLSLLLNCAVLLFCISVSSFSYNASKDFYNSLNICHYHNYYNNNINYFFAAIIGAVQFVLPNFNCYVLSLILLSALSFTTITYVFIDKFGKGKGVFFSLIINILFSLNHYADIESTKTAALLYAAGFLLVLNAIRNKRYNIPCWCGVFEIVLGSFLCFKYFFVALLFAVAFFFAEMIAKRKYRIKFRKFFWFFRPYLLMFVFIAALVIGGYNYSYSVNHSSQDAADYYDFCQLTDSIDLLAYPDYEKHEAEFSALGISENDFDMLKNGYYDKTTSLNLDALRLVNDIQKRESNKHFWSGFLEIGNDILARFLKFDCNAVVYIALACIIIAFLIIQKKKFTFFPIFFLVSALAASLCLRYMLGNFAYVTYGIYAFLVIFMLYSFNFEECKRKGFMSFAKSKKAAAFAGTVCIVCLFSVFSIVYQNNLPNQTVKKKPSALYTEINRHPECFYLIDPSTQKDFIRFTDNYTHPLWGFKKSFLRNVETFGYINNESRLVKYNLPLNVYEAAASNGKVYVIDNGITFRKQKYFNEHYAKEETKIIYKDYKEISGYKIYDLVTQ